MPVRRLREFLDREHVPYERIRHSRTFTSSSTAQRAHVPGRELAKTVIVKLDGHFAMAVVPATCRVDLELLKELSGAQRAQLASEAEFRDLFPYCDIGAMPPFGNLYGIPVYVARRLAEDAEVAFNAGTHCELVRLSYADFERLVRPIVGRFAAPV